MLPEPYHMKSSRREWGVVFQGSGHSRCSRCSSLLCKHTTWTLRMCIGCLIILLTSGEDLEINHKVSLEKSHLEQEEIQESEENGVDQREEDELVCRFRHNN